jgi:hypothetical protein
VCICWSQKLWYMWHSVHAADDSGLLSCDAVWLSSFEGVSAFILKGGGASYFSFMYVVMLYYSQWQHFISCVGPTVWNDRNDHGWWTGVQQEYCHFIMIFSSFSYTHSIISSNSVIWCNDRHPCFVFEESWVWVLAWKLVEMAPYKLSYYHFLQYTLFPTS